MASPVTSYNAVGKCGVQGYDLTTKSPNGYGVYGASVSNIGVYGVGLSIGTIGVVGAGISIGVEGNDSGQSAGAGIWVSASLTKSSNPSPALQAQTVGTGGAVQASVHNPSNSSPAVSAQTNGTGLAMLASSIGGSGVHGVSVGVGDVEPGVVAGVWGDSSTHAGVVGTSTDSFGVIGFTQAAGQAGVLGADASAGGGIGLAASSTNGTALQVDGVASFSRSGMATVAGTSSEPAESVTVTGVALTSSSLILATPQGTVAGVGIEGVLPDVSGSSFEIYLTEAIEVSLDIAWFVLG